MPPPRRPRWSPSRAAAPPSGGGKTESAPLAEQHPALGLGGRLGLDDRDHNLVRRGVEVLHHRIGDVLHQRLLLFEGTALDGVDVDFRHCDLPCAGARPGIISPDRTRAPTVAAATVGETEKGKPWQRRTTR